MENGKFEVRTSRDGYYYFVLKGANGEVMLTSERYTRRADAVRGAQAVQRVAPGADIQVVGKFG